MSKEIHVWIKELLDGVVNPVIFEIGANTGSDTIKLAATKGAIVHAFEPEPRCDLSKMPQNVTVNKVAVSDSEGIAVLNMSDSAGYTTPGKQWTYSSSLLDPKTHLTAHPHVKFKRKTKVQTIRLDDYCQRKGITKIDFLWMDVQGAESQVFCGAAEILKNTRYVYTEYSDEEMYEGQQPLRKLLEQLKNFEVMDIWPKEPSNVLLVNKEIARPHPGPHPDPHPDLTLPSPENCKTSPCPLLPGEGERNFDYFDFGLRPNDGLYQEREISVLKREISASKIEKEKKNFREKEGEKILRQESAKLVELKDGKSDKENIVNRKLIVRIDDFPTGVRPVLKDLSLFFKVFDEFEKRGIYFHLGIVPEVFMYHVKNEDKERLKRYKYLIPCQHGYDHRYGEMSRRLIIAKDPFNQKTLGSFNEFDRLQKNVILKNIRKGRRILELFFDKKVDTYTPVCNVVNKTLISILQRLGYTGIFTYPGKPLNTGKLKNVVTQYYGRLYEFPDDVKGVIGLHITWEYDYIKANGWDKWIENFDRVFFGIKGSGKPDDPIVVQEYKIEKAEDVTDPIKPDENTIPRIANFYWNIETPMSYLRYLTLVTFRYFHPDWTMNLWISQSDTKSIKEWRTSMNVLKQDFHTIKDCKNYLQDAIELGVNILQFEDSMALSMPPNYVSDIARFKTLLNGGWFFDLDQIFTRNFDDLCGFDFVTGVGYMKEYPPNGLINCGVLGASRRSIVPRTINEKQTELLNSGQVKGYNELGNLFLNKCLKEEWYKNLKENHFITSLDYFYPISTSPEVDKLYTGVLKIDELKNNYAVHWYGGHPLSQKFNSGYTEEFAKTSTDSISVYIRKLGLLPGIDDGRKEIIFITSISPGKESEERQQKAIKSWIGEGIPVYSVNVKPEVRDLKRRYPGVNFVVSDGEVNVSNKTYVKINSILEQAKKINCETVCIINSDIEFVQNGNLFEQLKLKSKDGLVIARRYNYKTDHNDSKMEAGGIDVFAFNKKFIEIIPKGNYCLGQPVWDYWFPLMFSENNVQIYYISDRLFYHKNHDRGWSRQVWSKFLTEIGKEYKIEEKDPGKISLNIFCRFMAKSINIKPE